MGDLALDSRLEPLDEGRFATDLSDDWRIWTLNGGYLAAVVLRAAGATTAFDRPATLSLQLLSGAVAGPAVLRTRSVRRARSAECVSVDLDQGDRRVATAHVWAVAEGGSGPEHEDAGDRPADGPDAYPTMEERVARRGSPPPGTRQVFPFWDNLDARPVTWVDDWDHRPAGPAVAMDWLRFAPTATFPDAFVGAGRLAIALDTYSFPSFARAHDAPIEWIAPNVDLHCTFHRDASASPWLLAVGRTPAATGGLAGFTSEVWSEDGRLLASGGGQMLFRPAGG